MKDLCCRIPHKVLDLELVVVVDHESLFMIMTVRTSSESGELIFQLIMLM